MIMRGARISFWKGTEMKRGFVHGKGRSDQVICLESDVLTQGNGGSGFVCGTVETVPKGGGGLDRTTVAPAWTYGFQSVESVARCQFRKKRVTSGGRGEEIESSHATIDGHEDSHLAVEAVERLQVFLKPILSGHISL